MNEAEFETRCSELASKIIDLFSNQSRNVTIVVLSGVIASVMTVFQIPRETVIAMIDSALEDIS